uniref:Reverse transcriptase domain-containing protein n=1 Tax=Tanacetum cinerariifolium TaxID=118510 RepID=A0A6L2M5W6_TANCI|nr:reverse transcriptase domain-containing protein [Tanacetum cinerariifolium]
MDNAIVHANVVGYKDDPNKDFESPKEDCLSEILAKRGDVSPSSIKRLQISDFCAQNQFFQQLSVLNKLIPKQIMTMEEKNLFSPLDNLELTIRRRSRADPTLLNDFEMATEGNGDPPVPDLRTMEELCQPTLNGRGGPNAPIAIQATNFGLKNDMIQQVQNSCQFYGLPGDDANKHLDKFCFCYWSKKIMSTVMV